MEPETRSYSQDNRKQKNKAGGIMLPDFKQGNSNNNMVLVQKQAHRPMKQTRELRNKTTHLQLSDL